jgi:hypothetical protein
MEVDFRIVGAQATLLTTGDLYNSVRFAIYRTGPGYAAASVVYLTGVATGAAVQDVTNVYCDELVPLVSRGIDATLGNIPDVKVGSFKIPMNFDVTCYSTNSTGSGAAWDTPEGDLLIDYVSDSLLSPHPTVSFNFRVVFDFVKG